MNPARADNKRVRRRACLLVAAILALAGCGDVGSPGGASDGPPRVVASFYPIEYLVMRLAGGSATVVCPVPPGDDPATWQPDATTLGSIQNADLIVLNGATFEHWTELVSLPESRTINTAEAFRDEWLVYETAITHSHGPEGEHSHEGTDGHTWLDPVNLEAQARAIRDALKRLLPDEASRIDERFDALAADLDALDGELRDLTAAFDGRPLLASHPAYNYLAGRYGWNLYNVPLDPGSPLGDDDRQAIGAALADHPARIMLWESQPLAGTAQALGETYGLTSVVYSPGELLSDEQRAAGEDFLSIMRGNVRGLAKAIR